MLTRRTFNSIAGAAGGWLLFGRGATASAEAARFLDDMKQFEARSGGRLGVTVLDTGNGSLTQHRGDERFPMCSTFKVLAAAAVLKGAGEDLAGLQRRVRFETSDLVEYSPVTQGHVGDGMSLAALCEAAVTRSDNTAANLMLKNIGGPEGLTSFARSLGDQVTRLDRIETELNEATPGDPRDTTSPNAMAQNLRKLVLGDALTAAARDQLTRWLLANTTGDLRLRAGLPRGWRVGDKTGTGRHGTNNDVAAVWPSDRLPLIVACYLTGATLEMGGQNEIIASIGRSVGVAFG
jgi:beta-lactamase class A